MRVFRLKVCFVEAGLQTRLAQVVGPAIRRESLPALEEIQVTDVADEVAVGVVMEAVGRPPAAPSRRRKNWGRSSGDECRGIRRKIKSMIRIAVDLPEDIAKRLETAWRDVSRGTLGAVALEGYRDGALTRDQVVRILGLSFWDTEAFLKERQTYLSYHEDDVEQDRRDLDRIGPR